MSPKRSTRTFPDSRPEAIPVDVEERPDEFLISAELPGMRKQDIDMSVRKNRVRITADFGDRSDGTCHRRERPRGESSRVVRLPVWVHERSTSASYDDGVLRITLPKRRGPERVEVG